MIGEHVLQYRIIEQLGAGGMGVVYKAEDLRLGRVVALKFLPPGLMRDEAAKERLSSVRRRPPPALDHPQHLHHPRVRRERRTARLVPGDGLLRRRHR
jgi:serine/threonine protein kinase